MDLELLKGTSMDAIPDVVTHIYSREHAPFANLCSCSDPLAESVLERIRAAGGGRRRTDYLQRRRETEHWLAEASALKIGARRLSHPIYFFLGDYRDGRDPVRTESIVLPLSSFPPDTITFTYPDSMATLPLACRPDHEPHRKSYHGQVFTLAEITSIVSRFGLPGERWRTDPSMRYDRFIEMQLWDDRPLRALGRV